MTVKFNQYRDGAPAAMRAERLQHARGKRSETGARVRECEDCGAEIVGRKKACPFCVENDIGDFGDDD